MTTATFLKRRRPAFINAEITVVVISDQELGSAFCDVFGSCFKKTQKAINMDIQLKLLTCQHLGQILSRTDELCADYIIFLLDTRIKDCVKDMESNLPLLDRNFVSNQLCVVNAFCRIPSPDMAVSFNEINAFRIKYRCPVLNAHIMVSFNTLNVGIFYNISDHVWEFEGQWRTNEDPESNHHLAQRIYNLISNALGLKGNVPLLGL